MNSLNLFLGIDPGYSTGYCFMDVDDRFVLASGIIASPKNVSANVKQYTVAKSLQDIIRSLQLNGHIIVGAAVEAQYVGFNPKTSMNLSRTVGALEYAIYDIAKVHIYEISPEKIKSAIHVKSADFKSLPKSDRHTAIHKAVVDAISAEFNVHITGADDEAFAIAAANAGLNMYEAEYNNIVL